MKTHNKPLINAVDSCFYTLMDHSGNVSGFQPAFDGEAIRTYAEVHICNSGFFVSAQGHYWSYSQTGHGCMKDNDSCYLIQRDTLRNRFISVGTVISSLAKNGRSSALVIGKSDKAPTNFIPLASSPPNVGMTVYALGARDSHFVATKGTIRKITKPSIWNNNIGKIICDIQVYHGFCGGPLVTESGELIGFGAQHGTPVLHVAKMIGKFLCNPIKTIRSKIDVADYRKFDIGKFESAHDLMRIQNEIIAPKAPDAKQPAPAFKQNSR